MTGEEYKKDRRTGVVVNTGGGYQQYLQEKNNIKARMEAERKLNETKGQLSGLQKEMTEIKQLLQQLLDKK
jgi:hypothetical protein